MTISGGKGFAVDTDGSGLVQLQSLDLDLSQVGVAGTADDIIDSTGSHGTAGQVLSSLGSGLGVLWIDP